MNDPTVSYFDVVDAFEKQTEGKDLKKIKGAGKFQLYKNFFHNKIDEYGFYSEKDQRQKQLDFKSNSLSKSIKKSNWEYIGIEQIPIGGNQLESGRVDRITFHPSDDQIIWAGTPAGGLWTTRDGGKSWKIISDTWTNLGIGDIVIDPTNPDNIYVATGDSDSWFFESYGIQISRDGGETWSLIRTGIINVTQIYRLVLDHKRPNILYMATELGLYKSEDSGNSWRLLNNLSGRINDIEIHPTNTDILHVATTSNRGWSSKEDEPTKSKNFDFAYHRSSDGGGTFTQINIGFENTADESDDMLFGRIAVSPADPNIVYIAGYANYGESIGALYKSTDAGLSFSPKAPRSTFTGIIGAWTMNVFVNPYDANEVYVGSVTAKRSTDGGTNWSDLAGPELLHVDIHDIVWQPSTKHTYIASDGGVEYDDGSNSHQPVEGIWVSQYAEMGSSPHGDVIIGGLQDNGSRIKLPSGEWHFIHGGDGMSTLIDPVTERNFYSSAQLGWTVKGSFDENSVNWQGLLFAEDLQQISTWETIIKIHPFKNNVIYIPLEDLFISTDFGNSFDKISLSNLNFSSPPNIFEIAPSDPEYMYVSDGDKLASSSDGGHTWALVQDAIGISSLTIDHINPQKIWTSGWDIRESTNGGKTWRSLRNFYPNIYKHKVIHQEGTPDGLYAQADNQIGYIDDQMSNWADFSEGLPKTSFNSTDIDIITSIGKIRLSTWGRGIWESDLFTNDPAYARLIPKPPVIMATNCGSSLDLTVSSPDEYDQIHWYKNDQLHSITSSPNLTISETGSWSARLANGKQLSYQSESVSFEEEADQLVGPNFVCEGSIQNFYIPIGNATSYQWNLPANWEHGELSDDAAVKVRQSATLSVNVDVGCGIRTFQKEVELIENCSQIVLDFDGQDDYLKIPNGLIDDVSDYTIETWFYLDESPSDHFSIYDLGQDWNARVNLRVENRDLIFTLSNWEDGWVGTVLFSNQKVNPKTWYHTAVSYDSSTKMAQLYLNGELVASERMLREPKDLFSKSNLFIGRSLDYNNNMFFKGRMDEFRFWNIPRSAAEINDYMNCSLVGNEIGLLAYYPFSDGKPNSNNLSKSTIDDFNYNTYNSQLMNFAQNGDISNFVSDNTLIFSESCVDFIVCNNIELEANLNDLVCKGEATGRVSFDSEVISFSWSNGQNTNTIEGLGVGTYNVTLTDSNGCTDTQSFEVKESPEIAISNVEIGDAKCSDSSDGFIDLQVSGGTGDINIEWSNDQSSILIDSLTSGSYDVTLTDEIGCSLTQTFKITSPEKLTVEIDQEIDTVTAVTAHVNGGTPPYTYQWSDDLMQTKETASGLSAGEYALTITDKNGCSITTQVTVSISTSTIDLSLLEQIDLFPNPTAEILNVQFGNDLELEQLEIYNISGQIVLTRKILSEQIEIDISHFRSGVYFARFFNIEKEATVPFTKL